jgi:dTDP-4-dehydrorhamnose reductase
MTWLVTGAGGQLGNVVTRELDSRAIEYVAFGSDELDITSAEKVNQIFEKIKPKVVINAAAWTDVDGAESNRDAAFAVNGDAVANLALASAQAGAILVHVSTDYVFSGQSDQPWAEDSPIDPQSVYGHSKAAGELAIGEIYPEHSYIVRTAWLYSEFGKNFAKTMCNLALSSEKEVKVVIDQIGQPTNANELAVQLIDLVHSGARFGIYHGTNSGQASWFEFAQEIFKLSGAEVGRVTAVSSGEFPRPAKRPNYSVLGHDSWASSGIIPMADWKSALEKSMPAILDSIKMQG